MSVLLKIKEFFKKQEKPKEIKEITLDKIINFVEENKKNEIKEVEKRLKREYNEIISSFSGLEKLINDFKNVKELDIISKGSVVAKNNFCDRILGILSNLERSDNYNKFIVSCHKILDELNSISPKQAMHIDFFFRDNMKKITEKIKQIKQSVNDFSEFLDQNILMQIEELKTKIEKIKQNQVRINYIEKNVNDIKNEISELEGEKHNMLKDIKIIDNIKLDKINSELENLMTTKKEIEQKIETMFGGVKKSLKKFVYLSNNKKQNGLINQYLINASKTFLINDKEGEIKKILDQIKSENKRFNIDQKRYEKICDLLNNFPELEELRKKYYKINNDIRIKKNIVEKEEEIIKESEAVKNQINEIKNKGSELKQMEDQLEENKNRLIKENESKINDMESIAIYITGIQVKII